MQIHIYVYIIYNHTHTHIFSDASSLGEPFEVSPGDDPSDLSGARSWGGAAAFVGRGPRPGSAGT